MNYILILLTNLIWGIICMILGKSKGINGFLYGFCLGTIGFIIVICLDKKETNKVSITNYQTLESKINNN